MSENNIAEKTNLALSEREIHLIAKTMFIVRLLKSARQNPDNFPDEPGKVQTSEAFGKCKCLSKDEILRWQHANCADNEHGKLTSEEFDVIIELIGGGRRLPKDSNDFTYYFD